MELWKPLNILSYGAGMPSTALVGMACENARRGYPVWPHVPVYDAVIFCDLHSEPAWVYEQADFARRLCAKAGIPFYTLDTDLYGDFLSKFGTSRIASVPFWTLGEDGKKGKMPRQCTYDYKIKVIERFVRRDLLGYKPYERTLKLEFHAHQMHMGIMFEERRRAKPSKLSLFENRYPLVEMGWTRPMCYAYNRDVLGIRTRASCCLFCPFHTNYFYLHIQTHEPSCYACARRIDELVESRQARPPMKSRLFLSKSRKRLRDLEPEDCRDKQVFPYLTEEVWSGF